MATTAGHTLKAFDEDLERLRALISQMGGLAEHAFGYLRLVATNECARPNQDGPWPGQLWRLFSHFLKRLKGGCRADCSLTT